MTRLLHPGEILREEFMKPLGLTANALAKACHTDRGQLEHITRKRRGIGADTALRLEVFWYIARVLDEPSGPLRAGTCAGQNRQRPAKRGRRSLSIDSHWNLVRINGPFLR
jgi:addiction module HigA family antidote